MQTSKRMKREQRERGGGSQRRHWPKRLRTKRRESEMNTEGGGEAS